MEKPITMTMDEFKDCIVADVNSYTATLPLFLIDTILKEIWVEVHQLSCTESLKQKNMYEKSLETEALTNTEPVKQ